MSEKLYIVKEPDMQDEGFMYIEKTGDGFCWTDSKAHAAKLTEEEIKEIDERFMAFAEEVNPQKYYLRHRYLSSCVTGNGFLNMKSKTGVGFLGSKEGVDGYKTKFTKDEIEEMKKKLDVDFSGFEMIEVE